VLGVRLQAEEPHHLIASLVEQPDRRLEDFVEDLHRPGYPERDGFRPLEGERLRRQFAEHDVEKGDQGKGQSDGHRMGRGAGCCRHGQHTGKERLEDLSQRLLTDPSQGKTGESNAELSRRDVGVEMIENGQQMLRPPIAARSQGADARAPDADQSELRGDEETISQHEQQDDCQAHQVAQNCSRFSHRFCFDLTGAEKV